MNRKAEGSRNERLSMRFLGFAGYACARTAASLGVFDVVRIRPTDIVLVQCKSNRWPDEIELGESRNFRCPPDGRRLVHRGRNRGRRQE